MYQDVTLEYNGMFATKLSELNRKPKSLIFDWFSVIFALKSAYQSLSILSKLYKL